MNLGPSIVSILPFKRWVKLHLQHRLRIKCVTVVVMTSPQADRRPELKRLIVRVKRDQEREQGRFGKGQDECAVKRFQLPKTYMLLEDFVKCIQECGIVKDQGTIHRLFDALTVGKPFKALFLPLPHSHPLFLGLIITSHLLEGGNFVL